MNGSPSGSRLHRYVAIAAAIAAVLAFGPRTSSQGRDPQTILIDGHEAVAGEVIVKMKSGLGSIRRLQLEQQIDAEQSEPVGSTMRRIRSRRFDVRTLLDFLRTHSDVAFAEPNYILHATATPNDLYFPLLWGLLNTGQTILTQPGVPGADIHAVPAWDLSTGSRANVVAVIDTGIDYTHPDLAANVWSAPTSFTVNIGGMPITCAAGTHGFNAITKTCDPRDDHYHGTHVSGTIGAVGNNGQGVAGVNWTASIMGSKFLDSTGSGFTTDAINAIEFTIQAKSAFASTYGATVRVLSNSWGGGGFSQALLDEINKANANEMLFVAAAGNNTSNNDAIPAYPASYSAPNIIAVAATDNTDHLASFSNYGSATVHLAAPGVNVASTYPGNGYVYLSGTSMATPHVSGAAALILSRCALTTAALKATILNNVDVVGALTGWVATNGRLNVDRALRSCTPDQPPTISAIPNTTTNINTAAHISFTVADPDTPLANVILSATSSSQGLLPNANITFSGSGATRTINLLPSANLLFTTSVTVTANDGTLTASTTFLLTVANDAPPTISAIPDQITNQGAPTSAVAFTVNDTDNPVASLTLSGTSSNTTLVPNANIVFGGSGANRTVTVTPAAGRSGSATITVAVSDGSLSAYSSFAVNVIAPTLLVLDTFTGGDATPLTAHSPDLNVTGHAWTLTGATPAPTLQIGRAAVGVGGGHLQATIDTGIADVRMATDYWVGGGPGLGALAFRLTDADNFLLLETFGGSLQFYRRQAGVFTLIASQPLPTFVAGSTHRLEVRAAGSTLQGWWDGVLTVQTVDPFQQTATRHGLDWNSAYDTSTTYDNFFLDDGRPTVAQVAVTPNPVTMMIGSAQTATAQASDANNAPIPGVAFTWATANPAIATVTSTGAVTASVTGVAAGTTTLTATAPNAVSTTINVTVTSPPVVAHVAIAPTPVTVLTGGVQTATAQASDAGTVPIPGVTFTWATANPAIATVTSTGAATASVTGVAAGTTTLTATAPNAVSATVTVSVSAAPSNQLVSDTFTGLDATPLTSHAPDQNATGHTWTLTGATPAPTLQSGRAAVGVGGGHLQATIDSGIADVQMATDYRVGGGPGLGALAFRLTDADNFLLLETFGGSLQFYRRQSGTWIPLASGPIAMLTAGSTHRLEVRAAGSTLQGWWDGVLVVQTVDSFQRTATRHGLDWNSAYDATTTYDNFVLLDGRPAVTQVAITPNPVTVMAGSAQTATAQASDANNAPIPGVAFIWATADPAIATVTSTGVATASVTGVAAGTTTLTATAPNAVSTTINVTVTSPPVVAHVAIAPTPVTVLAGGVQTATAQASDAGSVPIPGVTFTWATGDPHIAMVTSTGSATASVTGVAAGTTTLTATAPNNVSTTVTVTVTAVASNLLVSDTFTGANGTLLTSHAPDVNQTGHAWTVIGAPPIPTLVGGRATVIAGTGHLQATIDSGASDIQMATDYIVGSGPGLGALAFRLTDADNFLLLMAFGNSLQFYHRQAGVWTLVASQPIPALMAGSTHRLEVHAVGSSVQGWWDGSQVLQVTEPFQQTATRHGLDWNTAYDTTTTYDNFTIINAGGPPPVVSQVTVTPNPVSVSVGGNGAVTAQAFDASHVAIPNVVFTWATGNAAVATASSTGAGSATVTGVTTGSTTLTATAPNNVSTTVAVTVTAVASNLLVSDTFTGANGTLLTSHAPDVNQTGHAWTVVGGTPTPTLVGGRAAVAAGSGHLEATIDSGASDIQLATDYVVGAGPGMGGLAFRLTDADNFLLLTTYANDLQLYRRQGGVFTLLASQPLTALMAGSTHRLEVRAVGYVLQGWWDGGQVLQVTEPFQQTATRHGLDWNSAYDSTTTYDNLILNLWP